MKKVILILIAILLLVGTFLLVSYFLGGKSEVDKMPGEKQEVVEQENRKPFPEEFLHDQDRDGIEDTREVELGTSDVEFDTDGDGLSDKLEIDTYKTDPTKPDTDGDGFWDGLEIIQGFNPLGEGNLGVSN